MEKLEAIWRVLVAAGLGAIVGWEREVRRKPAGLRTNMLVSVGAAAFTVSTLSVLPAEGRSDPTRIIQGVATGIGFLGAGSIIQKNGEVEGLTTAAGIWVLGAVGVSCGLGEYAIAGATAVLSAAILGLLGKLQS